MITLKAILQRIVVRITGKTCSKCKHCIDGISCDNFGRYCDCVTSIYPHGFELKEKGGEQE